MPYALHGNRRIYYEVEGDGPPLILQHGFTQSLEDWRDFGWVDALRQDYRLILIDGPGHGASEKSHDIKDYQLDILAANILAVLDDLGVEKAHFFGASWGAIIGCALAKHGPHRLWSLVLGALEPNGYVGWRDGARQYYGAGMAAFLEKDTSPGLMMTPEYRARRLAIDPQSLIAAAEGPSLVDILSNLKLPCLLYAGEASSEYQPLAEIAQRMTGARFFSLPGLGHGQSFRYSHQALPEIKRFLKDVTPQAEHNRAITQRVVRAVNCANYAELDQCYHPRWRGHGPQNQASVEGVRQLIGQIFSIFADAEAEIEEITADAETVTIHWIFKGTHTGEWMGIASSGERLRIAGSTVDRFENGKIIESHFRYDLADLQRQLGIGAEKRVRLGVHRHG